jgi:hypothetical protein
MLSEDGGGGKGVESKSQVFDGGGGGKSAILNGYLAISSAITLSVVSHYGALRDNPAGSKKKEKIKSLISLLSDIPAYFGSSVSRSEMKKHQYSTGFGILLQQELFFT